MYYPFISCESASRFFLVFVFNDTATTEIYTLSLHDALPIWRRAPVSIRARPGSRRLALAASARGLDRKSTRLNSSHTSISYAVFCLQKKYSKNRRRKRTRRDIHERGEGEPREEQ